MQTDFKTLTFLIAILLAACSSEAVVESSMLEMRDNLYYLEGTVQPFNGKAVSFFDNTQPQAELNIINGTLSGLTKYWYADGTTKLEINIADKLLDGRFYYQEDDYSYDAVYSDGLLVNREIQYQLDENTVTQRYAENMLSTVETNSGGEVVIRSEQAYAENAIVSASVVENFLVVTFWEGGQPGGRLFFLDGEVIFQENYVDGQLSILLYHERSTGNTIYHCYYSGGELGPVSDEICTSLPNLK